MQDTIYIEIEHATVYMGGDGSADLSYYIARICNQVIGKARYSSIAAAVDAAMSRNAEVAEITYHDGKGWSSVRTSGQGWDWGRAQRVAQAIIENRS